MKLKNGVMIEFAAFWRGRVKNRREGAECLKGALRQSRADQVQVLLQFNLFKKIAKNKKIETKHNALKKTPK